MALTSKDARLEIEHRIPLVEKIETALDPDFQKYFVSAMGIPNSDDPYQKLAQTVTLPRATSNQTSRTNRNRPARKRYNTA